jgi:hypothetical protein
MQVFANDFVGPFGRAKAKARELRTPRVCKRIAMEDGERREDERFNASCSAISA